MIYLISFLVIFLSISASANAVCPVCTIAVGAGVGLSRWLGVDDTITGLWVGAFTIALAMWTINWFEKKQIRFWASKQIIISAYIALIVVPLVWADVIGHPENRLWGIDKLLLGIVIGGILFFGAEKFYDYLKNKNGGKPHFSYQKIIMPVATLLIASGIFYLIVK